MKYDKSLHVVTLAALITWGAASGALASRTIHLDSGSVIPVRLNDSISSADSHKGDSFTTTVRGGDAEDYGLPAGTKIEGVVEGARPQRDKDPGILEVHFDRVRLPDGHSYPINGSLIGLDNKSVDRRSDGRLIAKPSHRNDRLTYAGYGAGAGLIVGLLTKHPLEDTVLGGLLGYGFSALQKGHSDARDVVLKPGAEMGVRIDRSATLTSYDENMDTRYRHDENSDTRYHRGEGPDRLANDRQDYGIGDRVDRPSDRYERPIDRPSDRSDYADVGVMVDDKDVRFDSTARPILSRDNVVLVPVAPVLRAARVPYNYASGRLSATGSSESVRAAVGSSIAIVNGERRTRMEAPVQRLNGAVYVPLKFLSLATGYDVRYDAPSRTVILTSR